MYVCVCMCVCMNMYVCIILCWYINKHINCISNIVILFYRSLCSLRWGSPLRFSVYVLYCLGAVPGHTTDSQTFVIQP